VDPNSFLADDDAHQYAEVGAVVESKSEQVAVVDADAETTTVVSSDRDHNLLSKTAVDVFEGNQPSHLATKILKPSRSSPLAVIELLGGGARSTSTRESSRARELTTTQLGDPPFLTILNVELSAGSDATLDVVVTIKGDPGNVERLTTAWAEQTTAASSTTTSPGSSFSLRGESGGEQKDHEKEEDSHSFLRSAASEEADLQKAMQDGSQASNPTTQAFSASTMGTAIASAVSANPDLNNTVSAVASSVQIPVTTTTTSTTTTASTTTSSSSTSSTTTSETSTTTASTSSTTSFTYTTTTGTETETTSTRSTGT
ncbi:unnamed protein product, partial [Amoebophrya sp. A25]